MEKKILYSKQGRKDAVMARCKAIEESFMDIPAHPFSMLYEGDSDEYQEALEAKWAEDELQHEYDALRRELGLSRKLL